MNQKLDLLSTYGQKVIAFRPDLVDLTGSIVGALFLQQAIYWQSRMNIDWWFKEAEDWMQETRMSRSEFLRARRDCSKFVQSKVMGCPPKLHWRVDVEKLEKALCNQQANQASVAKSQEVSDDTGKSKSRILQIETQNPAKQNAESCNPLVQESTSESTSDIITRPGEPRQEEMFGRQEPGDTPRDFIAWWCDEYRRRFGITYKVTPKEAGQVKPLISLAGSAEKLKETITSAWKVAAMPEASFSRMCKNRWHCTQLTTLSFARSNWNQIVFEVKQNNGGMTDRQVMYGMTEESAERRRREFLEKVERQTVKPTYATA